MVSISIDRSIDFWNWLFHARTHRHAFEPIESVSLTSERWNQDASWRKWNSWEEKWPSLDWSGLAGPSFKSPIEVSSNHHYSYCFLLGPFLCLLVNYLIKVQELARHHHFAVGWEARQGKARRGEARRRVKKRQILSFLRNIRLEQINNVIKGEKWRNDHSIFWLR